MISKIMQQAKQPMQHVHTTDLTAFDLHKRV